MNMKQNSGIRLATSTDHTYIQTFTAEYQKQTKTNSITIYMHETWKSNEKVRTLKVLTYTYIPTHIN